MKSLISKFGIVVLVLSLAIAYAAFFFSRQPFAPGKIRNVLLISIDTCRADYLSCYGHELRTTPNIDFFAEESVLFKNVITPVPITLPAHSSMLTGTIPPYHGVHDNTGYQLGRANITLAEILQDNGFATGAVIGSFVLDSHFGLDQGFESYHDRLINARKSDYVFDERSGDEVTYFANQWLEKHRSEPFFLFVHYFDPHKDYKPPEPFASRFADNLYAGEIAFTDHCIGQVLNKLKELGLYESTLVIITADHGESLGEHAEDTHSFFVYNSTVRVPLIIRHPSGPKGNKVDDIAGLIDILPTVCGVLGIDTPGGIQGKDLSGYFKDQTPAQPDLGLYCETMTPTKFNANPLLALVTNRYKYIQTTRPELYDMVDDPQEKNDLIEKNLQQGRILQDRLKQLLEQTVRKNNTDSRTTIDEQRQKQLESIGYVSGLVKEKFDFDQTANDPKDSIHLLKSHLELINLFVTKKYDQARTLCEEILSELPDFLQGHMLMANIARQQGDMQKAVDHLYRALAINPELYEVNHDLGIALNQMKRYDKAAEHSKKAIELWPQRTEARNNLAMVLLKQGKTREALDHFKISIEYRPAQPKVLNQLAWLMATAEDEKLRDPTQAVRLAQQVCKLTDFKDAQYLDTLAAAYAAAQNFTGAVETAQKALDIAKAKGQQKAVQIIEKHLKLYKAGQPYRQPQQSKETVDK